MKGPTIGNSSIRFWFSPEVVSDLDPGNPGVGTYVHGELQYNE